MNSLNGPENRKCRKKIAFHKFFVEKLANFSPKPNILTYIPEGTSIRSNFRVHILRLLNTITWLQRPVIRLTLHIISRHPHIRIERNMCQLWHWRKKIAREHGNAHEIVQTSPREDSACLNPIQERSQNETVTGDRERRLQDS